MVDMKASVSPPLSEAGCFNNPGSVTSSVCRPLRIASTSPGTSSVSRSRVLRHLRSIRPAADISLMTAFRPSSSSFW